MIGKICDFIYYRTYILISETNKTSPVSSSARLLAISFFINLMTIFFIFDKQLSIIGFYVVCGIATIISFYTLYRYNDKKTDTIIQEFSLIKINKIWIYLINFYPDISILLLIISVGVSLNMILSTIFILIFVRIILYFAKM